MADNYCTDCEREERRSNTGIEHIATQTEENAA